MTFINIIVTWYINNPSVTIACCYVFSVLYRLVCLAVNVFPFYSYHRHLKSILSIYEIDIYDGCAANVAHNEIDLKNPKTNRMNPGFSDQEREKFGMLLDAGHTDTFRHLYPDLEGAYSWWSYRFKAREKNAGWRIDYFVVSDSLKDQIKDAKIRSDIFGSDHCPVVLELDI